MSDVLSQSEIDALLNALSTGSMSDVPKEGDSKVKVREYDFRTANRFSKEQIRTLNIIYEAFGRNFTTYLSGTLRVMCGAEVISVEELKYQEFINALPVPVVLGIVLMPPLIGPTMVELSPDVAYAMITRLLGGGSSTGSEMANSRVFTEIELVLLERIIRQFISLLVEAWQKVASISSTLERIETSPQFAQIVALNETVAIITLNVKIGETEGLVNFCLPHLALEPVNKQLSTKAWFQADTSATHKHNAELDIRMKLAKTPLPVTAVFADTQMSVRDILSLGVGDILQLDHSINRPMILKVGHLNKFEAALGTKSNKYALKIVGVIHEEEEDDE